MAAAGPPDGGAPAAGAGPTPDMLAEAPPSAPAPSETVAPAPPAAAAAATVLPPAPTARRPALLEVDLPGGRLAFDRVYLNGLHALRKFSMRNVAGARLLVKLRSNLGRQVAFQLSNDNLVGNTVVAPDSFNELLNTVGYIDEVELARDEVRDIVVVYQPDPDALDKPTTTSASASRDAPIERYELQEANGLIMLYAFALPEPVEPPALAAAAATGAIANAATDASNATSPTGGASAAPEASADGTPREHATASSRPSGAVEQSTESGSGGVVAAPGGDLAQCDQQVRAALALTLAAWRCWHSPALALPLPIGEGARR